MTDRALVLQTLRRVGNCSRYSTLHLQFGNVAGTDCQDAHPLCRLGLPTCPRLTPQRLDLAAASGRAVTATTTAASVSLRRRQHVARTFSGCCAPQCVAGRCKLESLCVDSRIGHCRSEPCPDPRSARRDEHCDNHSGCAAAVLFPTFRKASKLPAKRRKGGTAS